MRLYLGLGYSLTVLDNSEAHLVARTNSIAAFPMDDERLIYIKHELIRPLPQGHNALKSTLVRR